MSTQVLQINKCKIIAFIYHFFQGYFGNTVYIFLKLMLKWSYACKYAENQIYVIYCALDFILSTYVPRSLRWLILNAWL